MQLQEIEKSSAVSPSAIAITATFTAEPVEDSLAFWLKELDIPCQIQLAPYNQVFQQLLDPNSLLSQNQKGLNVVLVRLEDWERQEERAQSGQALRQEVRNRIERNLTELAIATRAAAERSVAPQLVCLCPPSPGSIADSNRQAFFNQMEDWLKSELDSLRGVYVVTSAELAATYPVYKSYDPYGDELGHIPYTPVFFTALGTLIARKLYALTNPPYKAIVLDCDQTLWKGVCGEDGALGIEIDPPRKALQEFVVAQNEAGMLVCLCSKNSEEDVVEVFDRRTEMPLKRDRIVSWRINWLPKSENIKSLAKELNIGLDSFIFIDDNPVECAEVQANCPEVLTLLLPVEGDIPKFLNHVWAFDRLKVTEEDKNRTALYQENVKREQFRTSAASLENFLEGLGLEIDISEIPPHHLPRVSQLTQRTNQFNFTTIRRSESEIQHICQSGFEILTVEVRDRFGDYGLVGVVIFTSDPDALKVDTFLLSCRALGRGVEHRMLAKLGKIAEDRGLSCVELYYNPTKKNKPALDFLESVASPFKQPTAEGFCFRLPVEVSAAVSYQPTASKTDEPTLAEIVEKSPNVPIPASQIAAKHGRLVRIASELDDAEQILKRLESQKRRERPNLPVSYVAPQTLLEEVVESIWRGTIGIDRVGMEDNFFELGGHSLLLTQLISRVRENFQVELSMQDFFEAPTVRGLAQKLSGNHSAPVDAVDIAELLKMVNTLTEEEARSLLEQKTGKKLEHPAMTSEITAGQPVRNSGIFADTAYRAGDIERVAIGKNSELVYCRNTRSSKIFSADVAEILSQCQQFKTLDEHARSLGSDRHLKAEIVQGIKSQLADLVETGFLISQQQVLEKYKIAAQTPPEKSAIASVGIVTCNRPDGLKRALTSYIENCLQYGKTNNFTVVDDSANPQTRESYRELLRSLKTQYGVNIYYGGWEEKQRFAKALMETGDLPPEVVNFALFDVEKSGASPGANRNALTLHSVGDIIFSADDDTACQLVASPELKSGLSFTAGRDPSEYWMFRDRQTSLESVSFASTDLLAEHEQLLGKSVGAILETFADTGTPDFNQINTPFLNRLLSGSGRVLVSFNGLVGDCGWGAPFGYWGAPLGYLMLAGKSRDRLVQSEADYRAATTSREILRVVSRPCISDDSFGMTTFVGLDNRQLLPPFLPVRRGQDLIFANSVWMCFPDAFFGHLPWALLHEPVEARKFWPGEIFRTASGFDTAKLIIECVNSCEFGIGQTSGADRMRALGTHLTELGKLPLAEFEEFARLQAWRSSRSFISLAEEHLRACRESPTFWANDLKKYIDILSNSLIRDDYFVPLDLVQGRSLSEARELAQRLVGKFGQLLYWWPNIVEVAKELRDRGQRLASDKF